MAWPREQRHRGGPPRPLRAFLPEGDVARAAVVLRETYAEHGWPPDYVPSEPPPRPPRREIGEDDDDETPVALPASWRRGA